MDFLKLDELASKIDNTIVYPEATYEEVKKFCIESARYCFHAVVVQGCWVELAKSILRGTNTKLSVGIGFPMGGSRLEAKLEEISVTRRLGADIFEYMPNIGFLKSGFHEKFLNELEEVVKTADGAEVRVMLEINLLNEEERIRAIKLCETAGVSGIKNSSGWGKGGQATEQDIRFMRSVASPRLYVKASGGIRDLNKAISLINAGASYIGTRSGLEIIREMESKYERDNSSGKL